jgi:O-acetyl-ADP-ribose deacetylase (regulator of RNase III)
MISMRHSLHVIRQALILQKSISTGVYGFPKDLAALIAVNESKRFLKKNSFPEKVIFVAYDDESYETYRKLLNP